MLVAITPSSDILDSYILKILVIFAQNKIFQILKSPSNFFYFFSFYQFYIVNFDIILVTYFSACIAILECFVSLAVFTTVASLANITKNALKRYNRLKMILVICCLRRNRVRHSIYYSTSSLEIGFYTSFVLLQKKAKRRSRDFNYIAFSY